MNPFEKAELLLAEISQITIADAAALEQFRQTYVGNKGALKDLFAEIKNIEPARKGEYGQLTNRVKQAAEEMFRTRKEELEAAADNAVAVPDLTAPSEPLPMGARHPIATMMNRIVEIFARIGFTVEEGPEVEDDWHNFTALNTPPDHPARDMQDTFYVRDLADRLLRTHTSSVQIRVMEQRKPPIRAIFPGRVYRNETISARAHAQFHQVEGLYIDENVSFADLKQTLLYFAKEMFGEQAQIRMRPSFFPFTEPSAEVDVTCFICDAKGCNICKQTGWVEILGCGMIDPEVLKNCGIDTERYTGFAFGMGIERQAMLRYGINDIRLLFENDVRFLSQFENTI
jgi:phenylalanyl-tRNA synthetase alpha chain